MSFVFLFGYLWMVEEEERGRKMEEEGEMEKDEGGRESSGRKGGGRLRGKAEER